MIQTVCNGCGDVIPDGAFVAHMTIENIIVTMRNKFIVLRDQSFLEIPGELDWCFPCTTAALIAVKEKNDQLKALKEMAERAPIVPLGDITLEDHVNERPK